MTRLNLAIIGCGAVTKTHYLPAIKLADKFMVTVLVDKALANARHLADKYNVPEVRDDYRDIVGQVDAVIVALPNYLHAPIALDLLQHGIHVFVEKPMALKTSECDAMIEAANYSKTVLAVGLEFRFFYSSQFVKQIIKNGLLGDILSFDIRQGVILNWAMASDYLLRKEAAGGGVLVDFGSHVLDLLLWWLGDYQRIEYYDDAMGGVEANCELHMQMKCGACGNVELSRIRKLSNQCIIQGERGVLEVGIWNFNPLVNLKIKNQNVVLTGQVMHGKTTDKSFREVFCRQLNDFADSITSQREPFIPGSEGRRVVKLIEECYTTRQPLKHPWSCHERPVQSLMN